MAKKLTTNWSVALTYYIGANLIALIPAIIVGIVVGKVATTSWQYVVLEVILFSITLYFALKWSANNINKGYVVTSKRAVVQWSIGYLLCFHAAYLLLIFVEIGYLSVSMVASIFNVIIAAILIYLITPKIIKETSQEEIEISKSVVISHPKRSMVKQILRTTAMILGGFIFLLTIPSLGYAVLVSKASLSGKSALAVVIIYELMIIWLVKRFVFKSRPSLPTLPNNPQ